MTQNIFSPPNQPPQHRLTYGLNQLKWPPFWSLKGRGILETMISLLPLLLQQQMVPYKPMYFQIPFNHPNYQFCFFFTYNAGIGCQHVHFFYMTTYSFFS
uniref:Uncharacterized protein n=1 Tax=Cacopsylla melanoneura TaxID=428564 RepID=A0A8D9ABA3_9HEMI